MVVGDGNDPELDFHASDWNRAGYAAGLDRDAWWQREGITRRKNDDGMIRCTHGVSPCIATSVAVKTGEIVCFLIFFVNLSS